jgi:U3-containing 90S pre-ribosomal complex subunit
MGPRGRGQAGRSSGRGRGGRGGRGRGRGRGGHGDAGRHGQWTGKRAAGSGDGIDFRWKKKSRNEGDGYAERPPSGDALDDVNQGGGGAPAQDAVVGQGETPSIVGTLPPTNETSGHSNKQKERLLVVKQKRRVKFEEDRQNADSLLRSDPARFLWERYLAWASDKLSPLERDTDRWSSEDVITIFSEEGREDGSLIQAVKQVVANPYALASATKSGIPGICVLLVASSGLRAAHLSKSMYDGRPVGKLFSKHIKKEEQTAWLQKYATSAGAPSAVGTARRLHLLCDEGSLTLAPCTVFVIDMKRDAKTQNILDMSATRDELFEFIHVHLRPLVRSQQVKILLHAPVVSER